MQPSGTDAVCGGEDIPFGAALGIGCHYTALFGLTNDLAEHGVAPGAMAETRYGRRSE